MTAMQSYPAYRDSGVKWLGEVPEHWEVIRARYVFCEIDRRSRHGLKQHLSMSQELGLVPSHLVKNRTLVSESYAGGKLCDIDDLVLNRLKAHLGVFALARHQGIVSPDYTVLRLKRAGAMEFFERVLRSSGCRRELRIRTKGIVEGFWRLYTDDFNEIKIPVPPVDEQTAIARFLDDADRRVRRYIRAKERLIELLEEERQATSHKAVTGRIDVQTGQPYPAYQDSGVKWLGEVPEHWEVIRARYVFCEIDRRSRHGLKQHLSMSQELGLVPSHLVKNRTLVSESYAGGKLCDIDDLVLNRLKAHLGVFALARHQGIVSPDYTVLRLKRAGAMEFFERVLRSSGCRRELRIRTKGIVEGFWRLYTDDFNEIKIPVPPVDEQTAIAGFLAAAGRRMSERRATFEREIALLREYRTRLIAEVVTGKLDVREAAANLPETAPVAGHRAIATESNSHPTEREVAKEAMR